MRSYWPKINRANTPFLQTILLVGICLVLVFLGWTKFYLDHYDLPLGCDEFGYLNLAEAIRQGETFGDHARRPFLTDLIQALDQQGFQRAHYAWMLTPHAYHVSDYQDQIINQYPPGTSLLLALFPQRVRQILFPAVAMILSLILLMVALIIVYPERQKNFLQGAYLGLFFFLFSFYFKPFQHHYDQINSILPSYGFLLAAGILAWEKPLWSIIMLALSSNFRLPNIILLLPVGLHYITGNDSLSWRLYKIYLQRAGIAGGLTVFCLLPYFFYVFLLTGNPFLPTYSSMDQEFISNWQQFQSNWHYYSNWNFHEWLRANVFSFLGIFILYLCRQMKTKTFLWILTFGLINYFFYLTHRIQVAYYPFATSLIYIGFMIYYLSRLEWLPVIRRGGLTSIAILILWLSISDYHGVAKNQKRNFARQTSWYFNCLRDDDVVWAELHSGTVEYVTRTPGFRFQWGTPEARVFVMHWLQEQGYSQAIWKSDLPLEFSLTLDQWLTDNHLAFQKKVCPLGEFYFIPPLGVEYAQRTPAGYPITF